ncbi:MAG TPA: glycosyltransferase family 39 protein [Chitinophagaceae bacterium]|nr:glycosyltransferase family 39 protein [Chitinophagaceae bacterium]
MLKKAEPYWPLILLLAIIKFVLPIFVVSSVWELQRDEFLYYDQGRVFDWGYLENPPLLSYLATISSWFGGSEAWIKFWPCLFGAGTVVLTCLIAAGLGGNRFAQFLAGLGILTGAFLRMHYLFQPNFLDIFFWTLTIYSLIAYINSNNKTWLYVFCGALCLGFLSKYSIVFMAVGLIISLLLSKYRKIFSEKKLWLGVLIGAIIILPNIIWQWWFNWPLLHHMKELQETQLRFGSPLDFIKEQFMLLLPVVFVWMAGLIWIFRQSQWRFLGFTYIITIVLLIIGRGKGYYAIGIYPMLLAAGAVCWERILQNKTWIRTAIATAIIVFTWMILPLILPIFNPEKLTEFNKRYDIKHKWEDHKDHWLPQDFADMLGWKEVAEKTEKFYQSLSDSTKSGTIVFGGNYGHAGAIRYYGKNKEFTNRVISTSGTNVLWIPSRLFFRHMILVVEDIPQGKDTILFNHFRSMHIVDSVTNIYSRQLGNKIIFYESVDDEGMWMLNEYLKNKRSKFER